MTRSFGWYLRLTSAPLLLRVAASKRRLEAKLTTGMGRDDASAAMPFIQRYSNHIGQRRLHLQNAAFDGCCLHHALTLCTINGSQQKSGLAALGVFASSFVSHCFGWR